MKRKMLMLVILLAAIFTTTFSADVMAARKPDRPMAKMAEDLLIDLLSSKNETKAIQAARELGFRKTQTSLDALLQGLMLGPRVKVAKAMLESVGRRVSPKTKMVLLFYTNHRRRSLRLEALSGIAALFEKTGDQDCLVALEKALHDYDASVRSSASWLLGKVARKMTAQQLMTVEDTLLSLLARGDKGALLGLGTVGGIRSAMALALELKKRRFTKVELVKAMGSMLMNPRFGPEPVRMQIIDVLTMANVPDASAALLQYTASGPMKFRRSRMYARTKLEK